MDNKTLIILGSESSNYIKNPVTRNIISAYDNFALNEFFNIMEEYEFNPTYYGCFNYKYNIQYKDYLQKMVLENKHIHKFFLIGNRELKQNFFDENVKNNKNFQNIHFQEMDIYKFKSMSTSFENFCNIGLSETNAVQVGIILGYTRIVLLGCSIYPTWDENVHNYIMNSWSNLHNFCPHNVDIINCSLKSKLPYFDKNHISRINTNYNTEIEECFYYLRYNDISKFYFDYDDIKNMLLIWKNEVNTFFNMRIQAENIPIDNFFKKLETNLGSYENINYLNSNVINYQNDKLMSIILIIKNKPYRTRIYLEHLNKVHNFNQYAQLIIVEDESYNNINLENLKLELNLKIDIKHYLINTNTSWNRSLLINYGLKQNPYKLSLISDVDFIFNPNYFDYFIEKFNHFDFNTYFMAFPCVETNDVYNLNKNSIMRNKHTCYGHYYIFNTQKLMNIGGYNINIIGHGFEERELLLRILYHNINILFFNTNYCKHLFGLHLSHSDTIRGKKRTGLSRSQIILDLIQNPFLKFSSENLQK